MRAALGDMAVVDHEDLIRETQETVLCVLLKVLFCQNYNPQKHAQEGPRFSWVSEKAENKNTENRPCVSCLELMEEQL